MLSIGSFAEANAALQAYYDVPGSNTYTLDRMRALMTYLGNPQDRLKVVHIAGTSGKGSTAYYVTSLLHEMGAAKVGLHVSPHVNEVNERLQINGSPVAEADFCSSLQTFLSIVQDSGVTPSYFELMVAFAYYEFDRRQVDYAVIEVGLGGLLDSTNVISREDKVCVITDIGLDHTRVLGNTLSLIAGQKAGIIQRHNTVFVYQQSDDVMQAVREACDRQQTALHTVAVPRAPHPAMVALPLFQQRNMYLALQVAQYICMRDTLSPLSSEQITHASQIYIPGRMDIVRAQGKIIIFDGAHNEQKMRVLLDSIQAAFPGQEIAILWRFRKPSPTSMDTAAQIRLLATSTRHIIATILPETGRHNKKHVDSQTMRDYLEAAHIASYAIEPDLPRACNLLLRRPEPILLVTGSFYMLHDARLYMHL